MKAAGIIAEYNPFHEGHAWQIKTFKALHPDTVLIVLCTDCFSSRGLPSLLSLKDKTELALEQGADLVLRYPAVFAMQAADRFALYAMEALKAAGVSELCFGSESADLPYLEKLSRLHETRKPVPGTPLNSIYEGITPAPGPNDILGAQYLRASRHFGIQPLPLPRQQNMISATETRRRYFDGEKVALQEHFIPGASLNAFYPFIRMKLLSMSPKDLADLLMADEGIENRLIKAARENEAWDGFLLAASSKTYTKTRIQRTVMMILLGIRRDDFKENDSFFTLIPEGMSEKGKAWLKSLPKGTPIVHGVKDLSGFLKDCLIKERDIYSIGTSVPILPVLDKPVIKIEKKAEIV